MLLAEQSSQYVRRNILPNKKKNSYVLYIAYYTMIRVYYIINVVLSGYNKFYYSTSLRHHRNAKYYFS